MRVLFLLSLVFSALVPNVSEAGESTVGPVGVVATLADSAIRNHAGESLSNC